MADGFDSAQAAYDAQLPFDSDSIDSERIDHLDWQIRDLLETLEGCDTEHIESINKDLAALRSELEDVKAGY